MPRQLPDDFDARALHAALDRRRIELELSWAAVARAIWHVSAELNDTRRDHPIAASTITGMRDRGETSCQHALFMLRWLERAPEDFVPSPVPGTAGVPLPAADAAHRLRWNLRALHRTLDAGRMSRDLTWAQLGDRLHCTPNQLTGLRTARFATGMRLAMRICQLLQRPAAEFVVVTTW